MFCYKCGKELTNGEKFCTVCGVRVKDTNTNNNDKNVEEITLKKLNANGIEKLFLKILFIALVTVVIFLENKGLFAVEFESDFGGRTFYCEGEFLEVLEYAESNAAWSQEITLNLNSDMRDMLRTADWSMKIGLIICVVAVIFAFTKWSWMAHFLAIINLVAYFIAIWVFRIGLKNIFDICTVADSIAFFSGNMLWYVVLSLFLIIVSYLFSDMKINEGFCASCNTKNNVDNMRMLKYIALVVFVLLRILWAGSNYFLLLESTYIYVGIGYCICQIFEWGIEIFFIEYILFLHKKEIELRKVCIINACFLMVSFVVYTISAIEFYRWSYAEYNIIERIIKYPLYYFVDSNVLILLALILVFINLKWKRKVLTVFINMCWLIQIVLTIYNNTIIAEYRAYRNRFNYILVAFVLVLLSIKVRRKFLKVTMGTISLAVIFISVIITYNVASNDILYTNFVILKEFAELLFWNWILLKNTQNIKIECYE